MKKMMMLVGAIVAAFAVNAASCQWTGSGVALPTGSAATDLTMYLIDSSVTSLADMTTALDGGDTSKLASNLNTTTGVAVGTTSARWGASGWGNFTAGQNYTFYTVILNKDGSQYMITPEKTAQAPTSGALSMSFGTQGSNSWKPVTPIPEPTSALLLVLGMAGLALKRKVA